MFLSIQRTDEEKKKSEAMEDEYDSAIANEAYDEYIESGKQSRPISELWKELDI